jgi:hypothetical protein
MEDSRKRKQKFKQQLEKEHNKEFSWDEASDMFDSLATFAEIALAAAEEEKRKQDFLLKYPKGFHYDGERGKCEICDEEALGENSWYDKHGLKCITCQNAINQKVIATAIIKDKDSWYTDHDLTSFFNIGKKELTQYIKSGFLKPRVIKTEKNKVHLRLFLLKDNKGILPPKKLLKGKIIKVDRNGEEYYTLGKWYEIGGANLAKQLIKYQIIECFPETFSKPIIDGGRFLWKSTNPIFMPKD